MAQVQTGGFWKKYGFITVAGFIIGALAAFLVYLGNPKNMGTCVVCFYRDIAGALGLHRAKVVQYIRPEILGFLFGALISSLIFREFRPRGGSAPLVRFFLGVFAAIGSLVFLGCPIRMLLRLAGGDLNAVAGLLGLLTGILVAVYFLKEGFNLGAARPVHPSAGWIMCLFMLLLLFFVIAKPPFIFFSQEGPGSQHADIAVSLIAGIIVGILAQRTRFCSCGAWRDLFLVRDVYLFSGVAAFFLGALIVNSILNATVGGFIKVGTLNQPVAQANQLWNFLGMVLAGLCFILAGGCPLRQTIMAGEGDIDSGVFILGIIVGAAFAHNFMLASSGATPQNPAGALGAYGPIAVIIGLIFALWVAFTMRERA